MGFLRWCCSENGDGGGFDGEAGAVAVEVVGEPGDVVGTGLDDVDGGAGEDLLVEVGGEVAGSGCQERGEDGDSPGTAFRRGVADGDGSVECAREEPLGDPGGAEHA